MLGKDRDEKFKKSNVVYKLNCKKCVHTYINQTSRMLKYREIY